MALPSALLLLFTIVVCQIFNFALCASELYDANGILCFVGLENKPINSNYKENVYTLLSTFVSESSSKPPPVNYFQTSVGEVSPKVYGSYLCRGDLSPKICRDCLKNMQKYLFESNSLIGYDCVVPDVKLKCMVHHANSSKSLEFAEDATFTGGSFGDDKLTKESVYNKTLSNSIQGLIKEARYGNWTTTNFATKVVEVPESEQKIYILVQCTPDMPPMNCSKCLGNLGLSFSIGEKAGGHILGVNCLLMYDDQSFFGHGYRNFRPSSSPVILFLLLTTFFILFI